MNVKEFENRLTVNNCIDKEMLDSLDYAYDYSSASTNDWVKERLSKVKLILNNSKILIEDENKTILNNARDLSNWISYRYPEI